MSGAHRDCCPQRVDASAKRQQSRACATSATKSRESLAGRAVGSAGGDVGRLHGNGRCQLLLSRKILYQYIYIYLSLSLFNQRKSCRNYKCSSLWEKEFCLHKFVSGRISVRRKRRRRRRRRRRRTPEKLRTSHKDVGKKHK